MGTWQGEQLKAGFWWKATMPGARISAVVKQGLCYIHLPWVEKVYILAPINFVAQNILRSKKRAGMPFVVVRVHTYTHIRTAQIESGFSASPWLDTLSDCWREENKKKKKKKSYFVIFVICMAKYKYLSIARGMECIQEIRYNSRVRIIGTCDYYTVHETPGTYLQYVCTVQKMYIAVLHLYYSRKI